MNKEIQNTSVYKALVDMIDVYDKSPAKSGEIISTQSVLSDKNTSFRRLCQFIFFIVLRHLMLFEYALNEMCKKAPKRRLKAALFGAFAEIVGADEARRPKVIDGWVQFIKGEFSKSEAGFANAVLRKFVVFYNNFKADALNSDNIDKISIYYSHPKWLVNRWISEFGKEKTVDILKMNQNPSKVYFRAQKSAESAELLLKYSQFFTKSKFDDFYILNPASWHNVEEILAGNLFYIQDPSTSIAPNMANISANSKILDLCAAPGGKSRLMADIAIYNAFETKDSLKDALLVSVDFGEERIKLLKENIAKITKLKAEVVECNLETENLSQKLEVENLPLKYDVVFLDAPCSNTGVLRRRPDARYRITQNDIEKCSSIQKNLLKIATEYVKVGGTLIYSTCSIEKAENEDNAKYFIDNFKNFKLENHKLLFPDTENDGCGAYKFIKIQ